MENIIYAEDVIYAENFVKLEPSDECFEEKFSDGNECFHLKKSFQELVVRIDGEDGTITRLSPNHLLWACRFVYNGQARVYLEVRRPDATWPGVNKVYDVKPGESWLDYLPACVRKYFEKG